MAARCQHCFVEERAAIIGSLASGAFPTSTFSDGRPSIRRQVAANALRDAAIPYGLAHAGDLREPRMVSLGLAKTSRPRGTDGRAPQRLSPGSTTELNDVEDAMPSLAVAVDGSVSVGDASHHDLLDQMSVSIKGERPTPLCYELIRQLGALDGFRRIGRRR